MGFWKKILRSNFLIKVKNWEYWPLGVFQFPVFVYFLWLSLRARTLTFFSASNPGIVMGGLFGESKYDVLEKVPQQYVPKTILVQQPVSANDVLCLLKNYSFKFPLIFKPDLGERGFMVKKINGDDEIERYLQQMKFNFLIQELVDLPLEFGVFYMRFPNEEKGKVTSVVMKEMLSVTGDGKATLQELIMKQDRAKLQWLALKQTYHKILGEVIPDGEKIELVSIGNHCLGTKFLNGNHLINEELSSTFDAISKQIEGFYFGRYDLRCKSLEDLYKGNVKVMELNGCGADPAHIYQPGYPLWNAWGELFNHWRNIFLIARTNVTAGATYLPFRVAWQYYKIFKVTRSIQSIESVNQMPATDERMMLSEEIV